MLRNLSGGHVMRLPGDGLENVADNCELFTNPGWPVLNASVTCLGYARIRTVN